MILLDNFTPEAVRAAVGRIAGRVPVEVSGGVTLASVRAYAEAGADLIAVGALTHSAPGGGHLARDRAPAAAWPA